MSLQDTVGKHCRAAANSVFIFNYVARTEHLLVRDIVILAKLSFWPAYPKVPIFFRSLKLPPTLHALWFLLLGIH